MTIAHVIAPGGIGGAETVTLGAVAGLRAAGADAALVVLRELRAPDKSEPMIARADALDIPVRVVDVRGRVDMLAPRALRRALEGLGAEVVHVHGYKAALLAVPGRPRGARLFATHHGQGGHGLRVEAYVRASLLAYRHAERVFAVSDATREHLRGQGVPQRLLTTQHNFLSLSLGDAIFPPVEAEELRLVYVGRLSFEKGVDVLLRALSWVSVPVALTVVGDGPERNRLEALAADLAIPGTVRFAGVRDDVAAQIAAAHGLVLPSRTEGMPMTMVEAMAVGRPVLATAVGGVPEAFDARLGGAMVHPEDPGALAAEIDALAGRRAVAIQAAMAGTADVRERFSVTRWAVDTLAAYSGAQRGE